MLTWLAQNTITAALLAALVAAACRLFRFRPAVTHALWLVVLVKLLTPPLVFWPWPLPGSPFDRPMAQRTADDNQSNQVQPIPGQTVDIGSDSWETTPAATAVTETPQWPEAEVLWQQPHWPDSASALTDAAPEPVEPAAIANVDRPSSRPHIRAVGRWLSALWAAGTIAVVALQWYRIGRLVRMARGAPGSTVLREALAQVAARLQVRPPRVAVTRAANAPLLVGLGRPLLLWPAGLENRLPSAALDGVLAHELAHLRRRDHWVGWLELAAACLWWWNPLFWYVRHRLREAAELACDAWVVHALPGGRRSYAEALIEVCRFVSPPVTPLPAVGMGNTARRSLERRLTMILRDRVPCRVPVAGLTAIALFWLAALPAWSTGQEADKQETPVPAPPADTPAPEDAAEIPFPAPAVAPAPAQDPEPPVSQDDRADPFGPPVVHTPPLLTFPISQAEPSPTDPGVPPRIGETAPPQGDPGITDDPPADPQQRLNKLESQLEMLLQEVRRLRRPGPTAPAATTQPVPRFSSSLPVLAPQTVASDGAPAAATTPRIRPAQPPTSDVSPPAAMRAWPGRIQVPNAVARPDAAVSVRTLSRATYEMDEAKATALAQLLKEHADDVETKIEGQTLIITAPPKAQQVIGQFIALLAGEQFSYAYPSPGEEAALGSLGFQPPSAPSRNRTIHLGSVRGSRVEVALAGGQQQTFVFPSKITSIDNPDDDAVEVKEFSPTQLTIAAKRPGRWQITVRDQNQIYTLGVFTPGPPDAAKPEPPTGEFAF